MRDEEPFRHLPSFEPSPYISSYLWFDRKLGDEKFWAFIHDEAHLNSDFYDLSNIRHGWRDRPSVITSNIIFSHGAHSLSDEEIVRRTHAEIAEALPTARDARIQHAVVNRIPMAVPCPTPGSERIRPGTVTPIKGLLLAGDWTRTHLPSCMESAVYSGLTAAEVVLQDVGQPAQLTLPVKQLDGLVRAVNNTAT
jgi:15-cis-phytoene desaturase